MEKHRKIWKNIENMENHRHIAIQNLEKIKTKTLECNRVHGISHHFASLPSADTSPRRSISMTLSRSP